MAQTSVADDCQTACEATKPLAEDSGCEFEDWLGCFTPFCNEHPGNTGC